MTLRGSDISSYQSSIPAGDFAILKATEGTSWTDGNFAAWWPELSAKGMLRGAYCFFHPSQSVAAQAQHFVDTVKASGLRAGDTLWLDHETKEDSAAADSQAAADWLALVQRLTGIRPGVYCNLDMAWSGYCTGLGGYPLWIADPSSAAGSPRVPSPWTHWTMHQYDITSIDYDIFNGDRNAWLSLGGQAAPSIQEDEVALFVSTGTVNQTGESVTVLVPQGSAWKTYTRRALNLGSDATGFNPATPATVSVQGMPNTAPYTWKTIVASQVIDPGGATFSIEVTPYRRLAITRTAGDLPVSHGVEVGTW